MDFIQKHRQAFFLGSLILLLIGNILFPDDVQRETTLFLLGQNLVFSLFLLAGKPKWLKAVVYGLIGLIVLRLIGELFQSSFFVERTGEILFTLYFLFVLIALFLDVYGEKNVTMETVYAVFSGFIMMTIAFSLILMMINNLEPNSLNGIEDPTAFYEYTYFGFITMLTIGYGDITPNTELTEKLVILAGLIGHFYTVFIMALIIGKLVSNSGEKK